MLQMLELLLILAGCLPLYVIDTLKHFSLSNFCAFVCKKILARKLLLFTFFFFFKMIRVLSPHSILVDEMSMPGTDKGDECPGYIFWLLWRSLSSSCLLHKKCNWSFSLTSGAFSHCFFPLHSSLKSFNS